MAAIECFSFGIPAAEQATMRFLNLAAVLAVAASGAQALAVARDGLDSREVHINSRRDAANLKLMARTNDGEEAFGLPTPVPPVQTGGGSAAPASRREKFRATIADHKRKLATKWPDQYNRCKCIADSVGKALDQCKCAAQEFIEKHSQKPNAAAAAAGDAGASAEPKPKLLDQCKTYFNHYGQVAKDQACKLKDMALERLPGRRKPTEQGSSVIHSTPIVNTQATRVQKREPSDGTKAPGEAVKPIPRTKNSSNLVKYFEDGCNAVAQKLTQGGCALGATGNAHSYQRLPKDAPLMPSNSPSGSPANSPSGSPANSPPGSPTHRYQSLPQEDPDSPRKHSKRSNHGAYAAQPAQLPDPAKRPGYDSASNAHKKMFRDMTTTAKGLLRKMWPNKAPHGQTQPPRSTA
ncbi:hypothetical protein PpBr36_05566 [Pyricularia pennisetigena]|uniref:hypothetical protein n=1 Tax=Pyricularia pennisetigena TaxID=1578925 RepID=UPI001151AA12|nr:hypothetical protein PpBr36_05566 [Pyricularia pennisetigena]TLS27184.1 hypothetical protein PpBr36_05566 [Pyricularia pennisetigena]